MKAHKDAYGAELLAVFGGAQDTPEIIERDDHLIDASRAHRYFNDYPDWPACEKKSLGLVKGWTTPAPTTQPKRMTPDEDQDQSLTEQEALLVAALPAELVTRIDHALLAKATHRFKKVARIVGEVMQSFSDKPLGIPDLYYAQRIAKLVKAGLLEARGDPLRMRFSEVRLPGPDLLSAPAELPKS